MIRIQGATRRYGDVLAVNDVSLEIARGEVVGLLGHNGAGKTTLMKMLTGVLEPTHGTLAVAGSDLVEARTKAQRHIGYLPESAPLYPEMDVLDYLLLMAELRGVPAGKQDAAVIRAARATGLIERLAQPIRELSKGFRQRVGIAQAIVHEPDVLVLDEPTNGLDPVQIESIRTLIEDLAQRTTIILSTHILQEVEAVCDRVVILIGGKLVADSSLEAMLRSDRIVASLHTAEAAIGLGGLDGVAKVEVIGEHPRIPGATRYALTCSDETFDCVGAVLKLAAEQAWRVAAIGPENKTLETVFKDLQAEHAHGDHT